MGWLKTLWGLLVDDPRLAIGVLVSLALGWLTVQVQPGLSGWVIIAALVASLGVSLAKR